MVVNWKRVHLIGDYSLLNLLAKKGFGFKIRISSVFSWEEKHFSFFHVEKSISQNYELLFQILFWKQSLSDALLK